MSYAPQPGTVAYRAIAWLQKQPAGHELTASMWAEAIDADAQTLLNCIQQALNTGLVKRSGKNGLMRPLWYSLGDGKPLQVRKVAGEEDERDPLPQRTSAPDVKPKPGEVLPGVKLIAPAEELTPREQHALERQRRLVATLPQTAAEVERLKPCSLGACPQPDVCGKRGSCADRAGVQVPSFRDTLAVHAALDAAAAREAEPQTDAVADAQVVASKPEEVVVRDPHIARTIAEAEARFVPRPRFVPRQAKQQLEAAPARETTRPETPRVAFDCWLSGVSGELVLQGLELDDDGDLVLAPERVMALRRLLLGIMT